MTKGDKAKSKDLEIYSPKFYRTQKNFSLYFYSLVAPKTVNFAPKRNATYMSETPLPNLLSFYPRSQSLYGCSGARGYADVKTKLSGIDRFPFTINVRMGASGAPLRAPTLRSARIYIKYISVVFALILAQKGPEMQPYTTVDSGVGSTHQHHIFRFL